MIGSAQEILQVIRVRKCGGTWIWRDVKEREGITVMAVENDMEQFESSGGSGLIGGANVVDEQVLQRESTERVKVSDTGL